MIPVWAARYVGIAFASGGRTHAACDCFGLVRLVLAEEFHVDLPSYEGAYVSAHEREEVSALIADRVLPDGWHLIGDTPRAGDGIVLRVLNRPWHVGVMVTATDFLHVFEGQAVSALERLDSPRWSRRVVGIYRHRALA